MTTKLVRWSWVLALPISAVLAAPAERLLASDVIWDDLFRGPATTQMKNDGVSGVELWKTDGTRDGTTILKDIRRGGAGDTGQEAREKQPQYQHHHGSQEHK